MPGAVHYLQGRCYKRRNEETIHWTDRARFQAAILQSLDLFLTPEIRTKYGAVKAYLDVEERKRTVQYCMGDS